MTSEDDFHKHLDQYPDDHNTRKVFADWLEEQGDPRAAGYRALGHLGRQPFIGQGHNILPGSGGWTHEGNNYADFPGNHKLPTDWFNELEGDKEANPGWFVYNSDRRSAEDAAAHAFTRLPPERQSELQGHNDPHQMSRVSSRRTVRRRYGSDQ